MEETKPIYVKKLFEDDFFLILIRDIHNNSTEENILKYCTNRQALIDSFASSVPFIANIPYFFRTFDTNSDILTFQEFKDKIFLFNSHDLLYVYHKSIINFAKLKDEIGARYCKVAVKEISVYIDYLLKLSDKQILSMQFPYIPDYSISEKQMLNIILFDFFKALNNYLEFILEKNKDIMHVLLINSVNILKSTYTEEVKIDLEDNILYAIQSKYQKKKTKQITNKTYTNDELAKKYKELKVYARDIKSQKIWTWQDSDLGAYLVNEFDLSEYDDLFNIILENKDFFKDKPQTEIINLLLSKLYNTNYTADSLATLVGRSKLYKKPSKMGKTPLERMCDIDYEIIRASHELCELKRYQETQSNISFRRNKYIKTISNKILDLR